MDVVVGCTFESDLLSISSIPMPKFHPHDSPGSFQINLLLRVLTASPHFGLTNQIVLVISLKYNTQS